jgi:hypothetical protein
MKKVFTVLVLAVLIAGGVFAQSGGAKNWVGGQLSLLGAGVHYERVLTPNWTVGGAAYWNSLFFFWNNVGVKAFGRYYPWAGNFFAELGVGFGLRTGTSDYEYEGYNYGATFYSLAGFLLEPGIGWKIDVGNPNGFYIQPVISIPVVLGSKEYSIWSSTGDNKKFGVGVGFIAAFGMGFAF